MPDLSDLAGRVHKATFVTVQSSDLESCPIRSLNAAHWREGGVCRCFTVPGHYRVTTAVRDAMHLRRARVRAEERARAALAKWRAKINSMTDEEMLACGELTLEGERDDD
jgi:hypothetical protein